MKILIYSKKSTFSNKPFGGAESSLTLLAKRLGELGNEVVFATDPPENRISKAKVIEKEGFTVHFIPVLRFPLQRFRIFKYINSAINAFLWEKYMSKNFSHFEIAHCFSPQDAIQFINWKKERLLEIKIVLRAVNLFWQNMNIPESRISEVVTNVWTQVDSICFIHEKQREDAIDLLLNRYGVEIKDYFTQDIGIDLQSHNKFWKPPVDKMFRIIMVGRFSKLFKRQDILLNAFRNLNLLHSELIFAGDGELRRSFEEKCFNDNFLRNRVKFIGFVETDELREITLKSSLFCLASESEGLCKSVLEAMSLGIPVLVSNVRVLNKYIVHNENGFLANNTEADWTTQLNYFQKLSEIDKKRIGMRGKEHITVNYNSKLCALKYQEEFERIRGN
ncbi:glycosyltransferase family 4 protein [Roseivirga seohaensis]|uniref:glycosyltransferase family 4 protein n=1 Tax=Roseivirga seohaensis TaxID=1914963 RepID=UPI003BAB7998